MGFPSKTLSTATFIALAITALFAGTAEAGDIEGLKKSPSEVTNHVEQFLGDGYSLVSDKAYIAPSQGHERAFFFAAPVEGTGKVGVWLIAGTPNDRGVTMSVNHVAVRYSYAPEDKRVNMAYSPASDLLRYVEKLAR